jgi:heme exporter protein B
MTSLAYDRNAAARVAPRAVGLFAATAAVIRKDLLLEWRGRVRTNATIFFALLSLLLFSFAVGPDTVVMNKAAPGVLWIGLLFASVLSLAESMRSEMENDTLEGLKLMPLDGRALFLGKALMNLGFLFLLGLIMVPVTIALYDAPLAGSFARLAGTIFLGAAAISAPGTLYSAIAAQARARDVLLPLLLFPILIPGLIAAAKATALIMRGDAMNELDSWTVLLAAVAGIYWLLSVVLFGRVIEE